MAEKKKEPMGSQPKQGAGKPGQPQPAKQTPQPAAKPAGGTPPKPQGKKP